MTNSSHILVLGATGPSGIIFCEKALASEHEHRLTIYARSPSKLSKSISEHKRAIVIQGDFSDETKLAEAAKSGATILVSFAGPGPKSKGTPITECYKILFPLLVANSFTRALVLCTPSWTAPEDGFSLLWGPGMRLFKLTNPSLYREAHSIGAFWSSQPADDIKWTLFRVPQLTDAEAHPVNEAFKGDGNDGMKLSRRSMVNWVMQELYNDKWVGKAPMISG